MNGETESVLTGVSVNGSGKHVGTYTTTASGTDSNYNLTFVDGSLKINKANATVTANSDLTKVYNGLSQTVNGFTAAGLVNGETESVLTGVSVNGSGKHVGTYTTTASGTDSNYNLTFVNGSLQITEAPLILSVSNLSKVYDGTAQLSAINLSIGGVFYNDNVSALATSGSFDHNHSNAGTGLAYTLGNVVLSGSEAGNYRIVNNTVSGFGAITPKPLIMVGSQAKDKLYDGNVLAQVTAGNLIGLVGNQTLGISALGNFQYPDVGNNLLVEMVYQFTDGQNGGLLSNYLLPATEFLRASILPAPNKYDPVSLINPVPVNPKFETPDREQLIDEKVFGVELGKDIREQCSDEFSKECQTKSSKLRHGKKFETFY